MKFSLASRLIWRTVYLQMEQLLILYSGSYYHELKELNWFAQVLIRPSKNIYTIYDSVKEKTVEMCCNIYT